MLRIVTVLGAVLAMSSVCVADPLPPLDARNFTTVVGDGPEARAPQGFGDRQNTWAWAMAWFKGKLYVGTNRAWRCVEAQTYRRGLMDPSVYPPIDPDIECTPDFADLPLAAEIWAWTPGSDGGTWARVYTSPVDVPNPENPARFVPRDIAYRGMHVFSEPDGTEALYVSGMAAKPLFDVSVRDAMPRQRLLRTTDGLAFAAVPQAPGTVLGSVGGNCFRGMATLNGKLYLLVCAVQGSGQILESANPKLGNNSFRPITSPTTQVFEFATFNNFLYIGTHDTTNGYSILKTAATGTPPYALQTVVPAGAYVTVRPNTDALSFFEFRGRLYVGGNGMPRTTAAELIRINPDDSWDVVAGKARQTPQGTKTPLTGLDAGFGNHFNQHMWRLVTHDGRLYIGTFDSSTAWKEDPALVPSITPLMGYDLMQTGDGWYVSPVTREGFGDAFGFGARTLASTPYGLFVGSANSYFGLRIDRGVPSPAAIGAPQRLEVETSLGRNILSWIPVPGATGYSVYRAPLRKVLVPSFPVPLGRPIPDDDPLCTVQGYCGFIEDKIPDPFVLLAEPTGAVYADANIVLGEPFSGVQYLVEARGAGGAVSAKSNLAQAPSATPVMTLGTLSRTTSALEARGAAPRAAIDALRSFVDETTAKAHAGDLAGAIARTQQFRRLLIGPPAIMGPLLSEDVEIMTAKILRRLHLAQLGLVEPSTLF